MNLDEPTIGQVNAALTELETMMPRARAVDVVAFEQLTALYAATYCLKLRMMK